MTEYVFVKPAPGGRIRMPDRNGVVMPKEGKLVPRIDYYERLILAGDLVITDAPPADDHVGAIDSTELPARGLSDDQPAAQALDKPNDTHKRSR